MRASLHIRRGNRIMALSPRHQNRQSPTRGVSQRTQVQKVPTQTKETKSVAVAAQRKCASVPSGRVCNSTLLAADVVVASCAAWLKFAAARCCATLVKESHARHTCSAAEDGTEEIFSLTRSVHLAQFAFAAYLKPTDNRVYSAIEKAETDEPDEIGACQTITRYFSSHFISQSFEAVVTLTILSADGLRRADVRSASVDYLARSWLSAQRQRDYIAVTQELQSVHWLKILRAPRAVF